MIVLQEEEEGPAEGGKDEPGEQVELKEEAEAPVEGTTQPPLTEPKGDTAPEAEKPAAEENGDKSGAQVSCGEGQSGGQGLGKGRRPSAEEVRAPPDVPTLPTQKTSEKGDLGPKGAPPSPEEEKKQKPARKQRMVEEIGVELVVLDLPDLPADELARSVQK